MRYFTFPCCTCYWAIGICVVQSVSFILKRLQDELFVVEALCYEHWLLQWTQDAAAKALAAAMYQISAEDTGYMFVAIYNLGLYWNTVFLRETIFMPHLVKVCSMTKSSKNEGPIWRPYLVKVHSATMSSNEVHIFGPHLVKVRWVIKSSKEGHIFGLHLAKVCCMISPLTRSILLGHDWLKSAVWQVLQVWGMHTWDKYS